MIGGAGYLLNALALGLLFPLLLTPAIALLADARPRRQALAYIIAMLAAILAVVMFADLAVDLEPVSFSMANEAPLVIGIVLVAGLIATGGAGALSLRIASILEPVVRGAGRAMLPLIFAMAFVQFVVVILRYVFGVNFIFMQESVTYMHGAVFLVAAGYALLTNDHVRVDIFYAGLSARGKARVDLMGTYLFLFPFCIVALWMAGPYVANAWAVREGSTEQSGIQGIYLLKSLIPVFAILLAMAGFVIATRAAATLKARA